MRQKQELDRANQERRKRAEDALARRLEEKKRL